MTTMIITSKPSKTAIFNRITACLNALTGEQWGYVDVANSTKYATSEVVPLKIGIYNDKKLALDIVIANKTPRLFTTDAAFVTALSVELQTKLLDHELLRDRRYAVLTGKLIRYTPTGEYAENVIESKQQWEKYPQLSIDKIERLGAKDLWLINSLKV